MLILRATLQSCQQDELADPFHLRSVSFQYLRVSAWENMNSTAWFSCFLQNCQGCSPENDPVLQDILLCFPLPLTFTISLVRDGCSWSIRAQFAQFHTEHLWAVNQMLLSGITNSPKIQDFASRCTQTKNVFNFPSTFFSPGRSWRVYVNFCPLFLLLETCRYIHFNRLLWKMRQNYADNGF